ncbi:hypothetical protein IFR05_013433 [Cadophora sp. M221]|nr:hypothetical protein IFR05_013433 [Cadophora sp. M221]
MVAGIESGWRALNLPENEPSDVAKAILVCATANRCLPPPIPSSCTSTTSINTSTSTNAHTLTIAHTNGTPNPNKENGISKPEGHGGATHPFTGKILFVAGGASYEIEERMTGLEGEWLGQGNSKDLERGQEFLMREGTSWEV